MCSFDNSVCPWKQHGMGGAAGLWLNLLYKFNRIKWLYRDLKHYCLTVRKAFASAGSGICPYLLLCWFVCVCCCAGMLLQRTCKFAYVTGAIRLLWMCYLWRLDSWFFGSLKLICSYCTPKWTLKRIATCIPAVYPPSLRDNFCSLFCFSVSSKGWGLFFMLLMNLHSSATRNNLCAYLVCLFEYLLWFCYCFIIIWSVQL